VPIQSVDLPDDCEQHPCAQKGMASDTVNGGGGGTRHDTLKCAFLTKYFDSVYVFLFLLCDVLCDCYRAVYSRLKIRDCFDSL